MGMTYLINLSSTWGTNKVRSFFNIKINLLSEYEISWKFSVTLFGPHLFALSLSEVFKDFKDLFSPNGSGLVLNREL